MTHLFNRRNPFYKEPAFALLVTVAGLWMLFVATSCRDKDPLPTNEEMIQGAWVRTWAPYQAKTAYNFHAGACDACVSIPARPAQCYEYAYHFSGDTLVMFDLVGRESRKAIVSFPTDTTCFLAWEGGIDYYLVRI